MDKGITGVKNGMDKDCYHAEEILDLAMPFCDDSLEKLYRVASELTRRDFRYEPKTREFRRVIRKGSAPWKHLGNL